MISNRISFNANPLAPVQQLGKVATQIKLQGSVSSNELLKQLSSVKQSAVLFNKNAFEAFKKEALSLSDFLSGSREADKKQRIIADTVEWAAKQTFEPRVTTPHTQAPAAGTKPQIEQADTQTPGIVTDKKTVHFKDIKALERKFAALEKTRAGLIAGINDPSGWKRTTAEQIKNHNNSLNSLKNEAKELLNKIAGSSYIHHADKAKKLENLLSDVNNAKSTLNGKYKIGTAKNYMRSQQATRDRLAHQQHDADIKARAQIKYK